MFASPPLQRPLMAASIHVALLLGSGLAADQMYGTVTGWGQMVDPDGDCAFRVSAEGLGIETSEQPHGLETERSRLNAPRVLRSTDSDFAIEVTVAGDLPLPDTTAGSSAYLSGGLLVWSDPKHYVRLERASFSRGGQENHYTNFEMWHNGRSVRMGQFADYPLKSAPPVQLRLEVRGETVRALSRHDGEAWHEMGTATLSRNETVLAGVHSINTTGEHNTVLFSQLQFVTSFQPVDAATRSDISLKPAAQTTRLPSSNSGGVSKLVNEIRQLQQRSTSLAEMTEDEKLQLIDDAKDLLTTESEFANRMSLSVARGLSGSFERASEYELALRVYDAFIDAFAKRDNETAKSITEQLQKYKADRKTQFEMIGRPLDLEGQLLGGGDLDWSRYAGKVVLVDFWASWCGPCRAEMPNVKKQYQAYHDSGFEVLGVCLDTNREKAEQYLEQSEIPWPSLFEDNAGWKHPMAKKYSVTAIPKAILVGRDGNVLSISARGETLKTLLEKQFPAAAKNRPATDDRSDDADDAEPGRTQTVDDAAAAEDGSN